MILNNINDILSVWTINYDILSIPDIDNLSLYNLERNDLVYMAYRHEVILSIQNVKKSFYLLYRQIVHMQYRQE